jgi:hypothetical protein
MELCPFDGKITEGRGVIHARTKGVVPAGGLDADLGKERVRQALK